MRFCLEGCELWVRAKVPILFSFGLVATFISFRATNHISSYLVAIFISFRDCLQSRGQRSPRLSWIQLIQIVLGSRHEQVVAPLKTNQSGQVGISGLTVKALSWDIGPCLSCGCFDISPPTHTCTLVTQVRPEMALRQGRSVDLYIHIYVYNPQ